MVQSIVATSHLILTTGRYRLYAAASCPFAHRVRLVRLLLSLEDSIHLSYVTGQTAAEGFVFDDDDAPEPEFGATSLKEVYAKAAPHDYNGRFTVPLLVDRETKSMVSNASLELAVLLAKTEESQSLLPEGAEKLAKEIDSGVTNPVYKFLFASTREAKEEIRTQLLLQLDRYEALLRDQPYVMGEKITLPDVVLWPSLIRYDNVYARQFGMTGRTIKEHYPSLTRYIQRIWELPCGDSSIEDCNSSSIGRDANLPEAVRSYWQSEPISQHALNDPTAPIPPVLALF